jgi:hypothetical protein
VAIELWRGILEEWLKTLSKVRNWPEADAVCKFISLTIVDILFTCNNSPVAILIV